MKTEERHIIQSAEDTTAYVVVKNLALTMACSWVMQQMHPVEFKGVPIWVVLAPVYFILYLGYRVSVNRSYEARAEAYNAELALAEAEDILERAVKDREEAETLMKELESKANAFEKMANDLQTLGKERQTLTERLQTLSTELAKAKQSVSNAKESHANAIESLKQSHRNATSSLITEKEIAEKEADSLRKELKRIKKEKEEKALIRSIKNSYSSLKKDEGKMDKKYPNTDWRKHIT